MKTKVWQITIAAALASILLVSLAQAARIKDIAYINGLRPNQLIGYGLVVGLENTGDRVNTIFTIQSLTNMLEKMGIRVDPTTIRVNNIAAVAVTADLPPFARIGNKIDVTVSSIGDARSLQGGTLLFAPLRGADGEVYAVAQGAVLLGGFVATGQAAQVQKNAVTTGRVVNGATIERELNYQAINADSVVVSLRSPDFTTVKRVSDRINEVFRGSTSAKDGATVMINIPAEFKANPVAFISAVENLDVDPGTFSKIVVNERTGTVVIGENVRIQTVAVSHGNISIQIKEQPTVSQPLPFSQGQTVTTPSTKMKVEEEKGRFFVMDSGVTIRDLVTALNALGVSARDVITILQAVKAAGALHAELEVL
ncbi:MAG TPA: flagellar basal body P-ring protein FlgI [Syntrophorhabdales bacterium]|nr:flagellar basal body P-ring protein FlgI [Syntrophorhabdales bacterium]